MATRQLEGRAARLDPGAMLAPRSIAVVGATERPSSYGEMICGNLARAGFGGPVWGVNPSRAGSTVHGFPCVARLEDLPEAPDALVVAVPARHVPATIAGAGAIGCGGVIVISAGFAEVAGGRELDRELRETAGRWEMPVCGPNGNGIAALRVAAPMWGDALSSFEAGPVAMVTQSGNVGVNALGAGRGIGFHTIVSTGNQAVLDAADWLAALARADGVGSVALFLEDAGDGERLAEALALCNERGIGVIVQKVGASPAGARAAAAHTGSLAGDHRVFRALVEEAGAIWAEEPHELLELARAAAAPGARPKAGAPPGLAVLTCSGGDAGNAADLAAAHGVEVPQLGSQTRRRLEAVLPSAAVASNPLDYTAMLWGDSEALREMIRIVSEDDAIGQVLVLFDHPRDSIDASFEAVVDGIIAGAAVSASAVLVAATLPDLIDYRAIRELERHGVPMIAGLGEAIRGARGLGRPLADPARLRAIAAATASAGGAPRGWLDEIDAKAILRRAGVMVPAGEVATDGAGVRAAAERLGGPLALKLSAPHLLHKSEVGAVALGIETPAEAADTAARLLTLPAALPGARLCVERMEPPPGAELLVSAHTDGVVPALTVGLGGIWAEAFADVEVIPLPADRERIESAIRSLRGAPVLTGSRGRAPLDVGTAAELAARVGELLLSERLALIELNPVFVYERGAVAVDALIAAGE